jgi:putative transposase
VLLLASAAATASLAALMQALGRRYVVRSTKRHGRSGTLWEGRFRTCLVQPGTPMLQADAAIDARAARRPGTKWPACGGRHGADRQTARRCYTSASGTSARADPLL